MKFLPEAGLNSLPQPHVTLPSEDLFVLLPLHEKLPPDRDKNKQKHLYLRPLPVRRADIALENRVSERQHQAEQEDRESRS
jgi:hypothetical protein